MAVEIVLTGKNSHIDSLLPGMTVTLTIDTNSGGRCPLTLTIAKPGQEVEKAVGSVSASALVTVGT